MQQEWDTETSSDDGTWTTSSSTDSIDEFACIDTRPPIDVRVRLAYGAVLLGKASLPDVPCSPRRLIEEMAQAVVNCAELIEDTQVRSSQYIETQNKLCSKSEAQQHSTRSQSSGYPHVQSWVDNFASILVQILMAEHSTNWRSECLEYTAAQSEKCAEIDFCHAQSM